MNDPARNGFECWAKYKQIPLKRGLFGRYCNATARREWRQWKRDHFYKYQSWGE